MANANRAIHPKTANRGGITFSTAAIEVPEGTPGTPGTLSTKAQRQSYIDRVRNYIPVEVIAFFIFANSLVDRENLSSDDVKMTTAIVAVATVVIGLFATFVYVKMAADQAGNQAWKVHAAMAAVAYCIWVYALDAKVFALIGTNIQDTALSGLLLASFTLFSGLIVPTQKPKEAPAEG
ncbi:hypothetical protein [Pseudooctadecabacter jejudonensis]|uniref:Uncharacterized protein n=1 Tax=Pseudooctadecabacter jejudonensis TaxID=1391910 RepID=A0A1Y5SMI1_9RHOB|nr:hypothetical protein [Pseudooctadecabacter jejudonensis]SLN41067.1 hypothetical protein PSJ8397_02052 [Pseudooctadecabacter jejudonensis]